MYTVALFITMAILLEAVVAVIGSVLGMFKLSDTVGKLPIIGDHWTLALSMLMVWVIGDGAHLLAHWGFSHDSSWINIVANGAIIAGMIPLKDAVFGAIAKGVRA